MTDRFVLPPLVDDILTDSVFFTDPECPFKATAYPGDPRVLVIVGENASGKSLLFRFVAAMARDRHKLTAFTLSIRERTGGGAFEMSRMRQMFIYGDEAEQSTGAVSARVVKNGFHNAGGSGPALLMLDEPEIGLSEGYASALGELIGTTTRTELKEDCRGVVVVTHSRRLVMGLVRGLQAEPTFVCMGPSPLPLREWLEAPEVRTLDELLRLGETAGERRKITHRLLSKKHED